MSAEGQRMEEEEEEEEQEEEEVQVPYSGRMCARRRWPAPWCPAGWPVSCRRSRCLCWASTDHTSPTTPGGNTGQSSPNHPLLIITSIVTNLSPLFLGPLGEGEEEEEEEEEGEEETAARGCEIYLRCDVSNPLRILGTRWEVGWGWGSLW